MLLVVLWSLGLLALLTTQMIQSSRSGLQSANARRDYAVVAEAADAGIQQGIFLLLGMVQDPAAFTRRVSIGQTRLRITVENQAGKINPNLAPVSLLEALLVAVGEARSAALMIAEEIVDWRTPAPISVGGGLKTDVYKFAGLNYGPPGRLFRSVDELGLLPGVTPALLSRLRPWLCLFLDNAVTPEAAAGPVAQAVANSETDEVSFPAADRVFLITVTADGPGRARFVRKAIVRFQFRATGLPRILSWETE